MRRFYFLLVMMSIFLIKTGYALEPKGDVNPDKMYRDYRQAAINGDQDKAEKLLATMRESEDKTPRLFIHDDVVEIFNFFEPVEFLVEALMEAGWYGTQQDIKDLGNGWYQALNRFDPLQGYCTDYFNHDRPCSCDEYSSNYDDFSDYTSFHSDIRPEMMNRHLCCCCDHNYEDKSSFIEQILRKDRELLEMYPPNEILRFLEEIGYDGDGVSLRDLELDKKYEEWYANPANQRVWIEFNPSSVLVDIWRHKLCVDRCERAAEWAGLFIGAFIGKYLEKLTPLRRAMASLSMLAIIENSKKLCKACCSKKNYEWSCVLELLKSPLGVIKAYYKRHGDLGPLPLFLIHP